ncbi:MAG: glycosyltransferase family A protein [Terracidiphilus sp.]|jgi:glycosyltransferase involved in cell wall biosynthesis
MKLPEISVIVPIYNGSAFLAETLSSLLTQTFNNFELLAINDGSTDNSADIVRSIKDERVRLIQKENAGLCHTLNLGITEARAPYIARSDQDDVSFPDRLERQLRVMKDHPEAIGLFSYVAKLGSKHSWSNKDRVVMAPGQLKEYQPIEDGCLLCSTMFIRTDALRYIGGFRQAYYPVDDWDMECRLAQTGKVLVMLEPLIYYRFQTNANTYRTYAEMREKTRWTRDSYWRRMKSLPELTLEQFRLSQPQDVWSRMNRFRKDSSKLHMRTAGNRYLDGHYMYAAGHLCLGVILNPADISRRLLRYLAHK